MSLTCTTQNGVQEGSMHYASADSSPQMAMGSSLGPRNGSVGSGERPKNLGMSLKNGYKPKSFRVDNNDDDVEDGSLPCTPGMNSDMEIEDSGCPAGYGVLANDTRQLITRFLMEHTGLSKSSRWKESKPLATMKRVVEGVLEKHRYAYNGMIRTLSLDDRGDAEFVRSVAQSLFADGTTNWGRIASLVAFGAAVSQYLKEIGKDNFVEMVGEEISSYLLSEQREWLVKNNSWDGFVEFFRVADPESTVRNTLMAVAGFAGIGATLALLIR